MVKTRDIIYTGAKLLTAPLPASHRMLLSPVRSIVVDSTGIPDQESMLLIASAIEKYTGTLGIRKSDKRNKAGYEIVDCDLLLSALDELGIKKI